MPGSTKRKPQHRNAQGLYPFARLHSHTGQPFLAAEAFRSQLVALHRGRAGARGLTSSHRSATCKLFRACYAIALPPIPTLPRPTRRRYGLLHRRLRPRLVRVRYCSRSFARLPLLRSKYISPVHLHSPNPYRSSSLGCLEQGVDSALISKFCGVLSLRWSSTTLVRLWSHLRSARQEDVPRLLRMYGPPQDCKGKVWSKTSLRKCIRPLGGD